MKQCVNGHEVADGQRFCSECGTPIPPEAGVGPDQPSEGAPPAAGVVQGTAREPERKRRRWVLAAAIVAVLAVAGVGAALLLGSSDRNEVSGLFRLLDVGVQGSALNCSGTGGYDDFRAGMDVTVRDGDGSLLAAGSVRHPEDIDELVEFLIAAGESDSVSDARKWIRDTERISCYLVWELDVPKSEFYVVEIGRRGDLTFTHEELVEQNWMVVTSLG